eukprot:gnl/MRDRNA2_/MRDRNA2_109700_c0_seq1.p1 gnl/MRDRNA2_/MRDRNA2_109700_c0~~gnl/MRDRNA2_/MRDRNA2_109700_c0_seq1.p1  ORF type:complete len:559 (+),score=173.81 gnl/MRDRNA2_/MRDRNA2_109700_c0_seq1:113-1678(+)
MLHLITCCRNGSPIPPLEEGLPPELLAVLSESLGSPRELADRPEPRLMSPRMLSMESPSASSSSSIPESPRLSSPLPQADWWASPASAAAPMSEYWGQQAHASPVFHSGSTRDTYEQKKEQKKKERQRQLEKHRQREEDARREYHRRLEERRRREEQEAWHREEEARKDRLLEEERRRQEEEQRRKDERRQALEDEEQRRLHEERRHEAEERRRRDEEERNRLEEEEKLRIDEEKRHQEEEDRAREVEKARRRKEAERRSEEEKARRDLENSVERLETVIEEDRAFVEKLRSTSDDIAEEIRATRDTKDHIQLQIESQEKAREELQFERVQLADQLQSSEQRLRMLRNERWGAVRDKVPACIAGRERLAEEIVFLQRAVEDRRKSLEDVEKTNMALDSVCNEMQARSADLQDDRREVLVQIHTQQELMKQEERENAEMKMALDRLKQDVLHSRSRCGTDRELKAIEDVKNIHPKHTPKSIREAESAVDNNDVMPCSSEANANAFAKVPSSRTRFLVLLEGV